MSYLPLPEIGDQVSFRQVNFRSNQQSNLLIKNCFFWYFSDHKTILTEYRNVHQNCIKRRMTSATHAV